MKLSKLDIDIEKGRQSKDILRKVANQVIKDFAQFGFDIGFSGDIEYVYNELFEQLADHVGVMIQHNLEKLYNVLYRIDVGEKAIHELAALNSDTSINEVIAGMVLDRELKKVLTREYFKQNS